MLEQLPDAVGQALGLDLVLQALAHDIQFAEELFGPRALGDDPIRPEDRQPGSHGLLG